MDPEDFQRRLEENSDQANSINTALEKIKTSLRETTQGLSENVPQELAQWSEGIAPSPAKSHHSPMSENPSREEVKANVEAAEARGETKIARIEGKLDLVLSKLDESRADNRATRANSLVGFFSLAALIVALAFGLPAIFGYGTSLRDIVRAEVQQDLVHQPTTATKAP